MKTLDPFTTDYVAIVGELNVWKDSAYFHTEAMQDLIAEFGQSFTNEIYSEMMNSHMMVIEHFLKKEKTQLSFNDLDILMEFFNFEFKIKPGGCYSIMHDDFTQKSQYLIRITRK